MNATSTIVLSLIAGSAAGVLATKVAGPKAPAAAAPIGLEPDRLESLNATIEELRSEQQELRQALRDAQAMEGPARVDLAQIESVVARMLRDGTPAEALAAADLDGASAGAQAEVLDPSERYGDLFELSEEELTARWKELREAGLEEEALEYFQSLAEASPSDPEAQFELGQAYIMKLQGLGSSPEAGRVATLADQSFDKTLELDPQHWDARFTKAVALSFWPPIFGKQAEAVKQFEILVGQQATQTPQDGFASTHLLLGNLYQQLGQGDKAMASWQTGAELFPSNEDLAGKLGQ